MATELEVLGTVSDRLTSLGLPFMLTGSFALAYYATPRMTRDLDIVVALGESDVASLVADLSPDFYVDADLARDAVRSEGLFNLLHLESGLKIDLIVRKSPEYRQLEFSRRQSVSFGTLRTWIVSAEDLILSKLVWANDSASELQMRDVSALLATPVDIGYIRTWAPRLGVERLLNEALA